MGDLIHMPLEPYLNRTQLAKSLGMSTKWVDHRVREGMPSVKWGARSRRFLRSEVVDWLNDREP